MYNLYIMQQSHSFARTQIYLTQYQQQRLAEVSRRASVTKSELIRLAVDQFLDQQVASGPVSKVERLAGLAGLWADRSDMADPTAYVEVMRKPRF